MSDTIYKPSYWNEEGSEQDLYESLHDRFVPVSGEAPTITGELVRSISNIYYDVFNNGGCNLSGYKDEVDFLFVRQMNVRRIRKEIVVEEDFNLVRRRLRAYIECLDAGEDEMYEPQDLITDTAFVRALDNVVTATVRVAKELSDEG